MQKFIESQLVCDTEIEVCHLMTYFVLDIPVGRQLGALHLLQELLVLLPAGDRVGRGHHVGEGGLAAGQTRHQQAQQDRHDPRTGVGHPHHLGLSAHIT